MTWMPETAADALTGPIWTHLLVMALAVLVLVYSLSRHRR